MQTAAGDGKVVIFSSADAYWPKNGKYTFSMGGEGFMAPTAKGAEDFAYHSVFTDGKYFYDPLLSASPVPQSQYMGMLKDINPGGVSWRIYTPEVPNPTIPQLKKDGF